MEETGQKYGSSGGCLEGEVREGYRDLLLH
jgi:hypothetical protein